MTERRKRANYWCERRMRVQNTALLSICAVSAVSATVVYGATTGIESLDEHASVLIGVLASMIVLTFGAIASLVVWAYKDLKISQRGFQREMDDRLREIKSLMEKRQDLLLETRRVLFELEGEHKSMVERHARYHREEES